VKFEPAGEGLYIIEATTKNNNLKYGLIDGKGNIIVPIEYSKVTEFNEGLCRAESEKGKFFIDTHGKHIIDVSEYYYIGNFKFGFASVTRELSSKTESGFKYDYMLGLIDKSGNEVLACEYSQTGCFENGMLWAESDQGFALFDVLGKRVNDLYYSYVHDAGEGLIIAAEDGKYGYIDKDCRFVIPPSYEEANGFFDGAAMVSNDGQSFFIDTKGQRLSPPEVAAAGDFSEGFGLVTTGNMYGFVDTRGNLTIPCEFNEAYGFINSVARVTITVGISPYYCYSINKSGKIAIKPEEQGYFKWNDSYIVYFNSEEGTVEDDIERIALIDNNGKRISAYYFGIGEYIEGLAVADNYSGSVLKYGVIDKMGNEIVPLIYDAVSIVDSGSCIVQMSETGKNSMVGVLRCV